MPTKVRQDLFDTWSGCQRGRSVWIEGLWLMVKAVFFLTVFPWPNAFKCYLLRLFGAKVGHGVVIKPRVHIYFPWKLEVGDRTWLGEEVFILNLERVCIGAHCCVAQRSFLCTGNHDLRKPEVPYSGKPITLEDGVWIGAQAFVGPGVKVGEDTAVFAGSVVTKNLEPGKIYQGNPCVERGARWK